jgi:hypothetical protein
LNHTGDKFRIWDPDTERVHLSHDIIWTGRIYFDSKQKVLEGPFIHPILENKNNNKINNETENERKERNDENDDDLTRKRSTW